MLTRSGYIGYELAEELCSVLSEYTKIMAGYKVDAYKVCASAAIRDAKNELFILDQIKLRTKLDVEVLSNSEHRFISYKSVAARPEFNKMIEKGAAVVDVGGEVCRSRCSRKERRSRRSTFYLEPCVSMKNFPRSETLSYIMMI